MRPGYGVCAGCGRGRRIKQDGTVGQHHKLTDIGGYSIGRCRGVDQPPLGLLAAKPDSHLKVFIDVKGSRPMTSPEDQVKRDRIADSMRFWPMSQAETEAWAAFAAAAPQLAERMRDAAAGLHDIGPRMTGAMERLAITMERIREELTAQGRRNRV